jgi:hypothetical protein
MLRWIAALCSGMPCGSSSAGMVDQNRIAPATKP